ncbi:hypothetical protein [Leptolyngbya sp. AN02str]|uniref:hypothetical protein n=1 Tax=Leptolyngbya sp. AN02str TaxID=3423363 RepID=UPI003D31434B
MLDAAIYSRVANTERSPSVSIHILINPYQLDGIYWICAWGSLQTQARLFWQFLPATSH